MTKDSSCFKKRRKSQGRKKIWAKRKTPAVS